MSTVVAMQPYFFPYVGYFQLLQAADVIVWLDDAQLTSRGWMTRNRILVDGVPTWVSLPVSRHGHRPSLQQATYLHDHPLWAKTRRKVEHAYARSPGRDLVLSSLDAALSSPDHSVAAVNIAGVAACLTALEIDREVRLASELQLSGATGAERILEICDVLGASTYVNLPGGRHLYSPDEFTRRGLALRFLEPTFVEYPQRTPAFVPGLSILDVIAGLGVRCPSAVGAGTFALLP